MHLLARCLWVVAGLGVFAATSVADARPDVRQLSCQAANALVGQSGEIVMSTGRTTFRRFVRDLGFCARYQSLEPYQAVAADTDACVIRSICVDRKRTGDQR